MAETTEFGHDELGHLLADYLLEVPRFQRSYSWDAGNVEEYLTDLEQARSRDTPYFMGTVVFANPAADGGRRQIVDGQQRLATTAILIVAIRDLLRSYGKARQADEMEKRYLRGYVLSADAVMERMILAPKDQESYLALLEGRLADVEATDPIRECYDASLKYLARVAPTGNDFLKLIEITTQLEDRVQVLVAVASDLPEAYVIFETLNDRGADLTTADLLKNYLFSAAGDYFSFVESRWASLEASIDKPNELVKFIRYEYVSRHGQVSTRKLYRAIQADIAGSPTKTRNYLRALVKAQEIYLAIRDPDSSYWAELQIEVRDALYAYRRFGFEAPFPVLIAAFQNWTKLKAARLLIKVAKWSVRGHIAGRLGGTAAEEAFGMTARDISRGTAGNQILVRIGLREIIPTDSEFMAAFTNMGDVTVSKAKYMLAMLEKAYDEVHNLTPRPLEWYARSVTIEHIGPQSSRSIDDSKLNEIGNLGLLEKGLNMAAGSRPFIQKKASYKDSQFKLTTHLARKRSWTAASIDARTAEFAELACKAWPAS